MDEESKTLVRGLAGSVDKLTDKLGEKVAEHAIQLAVQDVRLKTNEERIDGVHSKIADHIKYHWKTIPVKWITIIISSLVGFFGFLIVFAEQIMKWIG